MILTVKDLQNKIKNDKAFRDQLLVDFPQGTNPALHEVVSEIMASDRVEDLNENLITIYLEAVETMRAEAMEHPEDARLSARWPQYLRVPFGEDVFEINANSRSITIPNIFKQNGIAVVGDHLAEILYFTIDRFYDITDLSQTDILIQWRNLGGQRSGNSIPTVSKPFAVYATSEKLYFGWIVDKNMTAYAGNIEFAVHFRTINEDNATTFILNTQPATIKVNADIGFNVNIDTLPRTEDYSVLINSRPMYSHIVNTLNAAEPIIAQNLIAGYYDLEGENNTTPISWTVAAISPDGTQDSLSFVWQWNGVPCVVNNNGIVTNVVYPPEKGTLVVDGEITVVEEDLYNHDGEILATIATVAALNEIKNPVNSGVYMLTGVGRYVYTNNEFVACEVIGRKSTITTNVPGRYEVMFGNKVLDTNNPNYGGVRYVDSPMAYLNEAAQITVNDDMLPDFAYIVNYQEPTFTADYLEHDDPNVRAIDYYWYKVTTENNTRVETLVPEGGRVANYHPSVRGTYCCKITNTKNNSRSSDYSKDILVEMSPVVPSGTDMIIANDWATTIRENHKFNVHVNSPDPSKIATEDAWYKVMVVIQELGTTQPVYYTINVGNVPCDFEVNLNTNGTWEKLRPTSTYEVNLLFTQVTMPGQGVLERYPKESENDNTPIYATQDHAQTWIKFRPDGENPQ